MKLYVPRQTNKRERENKAYTGSFKCLYKREPENKAFSCSFMLWAEHMLSFWINENVPNVEDSLKHINYLLCPVPSFPFRFLAKKIRKSGKMSII